MQTKTLYKSIIAASLAASALIFSGCNQAAPAVAVSNVQKTFKTELNQDTLKNALAKAASAEAWRVNHSESHAIRLNKSFTIVEPWSWEPEEKHYDVLVDVNIANNTLSIKPVNVEELADNEAKALFNKKLAKLEKAIYIELIPHTL